MQQPYALIVEDTDADFEQLATQLQHDFQVVRARSLHEGADCALALFAHPAPGIILVDMHLPHANDPIGIDGYYLIGSLSESMRQGRMTAVPIIGISADMSRERFEGIARAGGSAGYEKPLSAEQCALLLPLAQSAPEPLRFDDEQRWFRGAAFNIVEYFRRTQGQASQWTHHDVHLLFTALSHGFHYDSAADRERGAAIVARLGGFTPARHYLKQHIEMFAADHDAGATYATLLRHILYGTTQEGMQRILQCGRKRFLSTLRRMEDTLAQHLNHHP